MTGCTMLGLLLAGCLTPRGGGDRAGVTRGDAPRDPETVSLLGRPLFATPPGADIAKLEAQIAAARVELAEQPDDPGRIVWVGRRLGYLWRMNDAVEVFTRGIASHPTYAPLYRHRGHRYISLRRFAEAIADLEKAAQLIQGAETRIEPDGMPNARNLPLTTTAFNVWYHLGLARYLSGDFEGALAAYRVTMTYARRYDDNIVATTDWMYLTLTRLGRDDEADALLARISPEMDIIENHAYHRRLLMYKGLIPAEDLMDADHAGDLDVATLGYGLGTWYLCQGQVEKAKVVYERVVAGPYWPAFGFIAAEVELARMKDHRGQ